MAVRPGAGRLHIKFLVGPAIPRTDYLSVTAQLQERQQHNSQRHRPIQRPG